MLQDVIHPSEELSIEEGISSPIAAQILDFCNDGDFFPETLSAADVSSCPVPTTSPEGLCCYDDASFAFDPAAISALLDSQQPSDPDHPDVIPPPAMFPDQFDQILLADVISGGGYSAYSPDDSVIQIPLGTATQQLVSIYEEECLPQLPGYLGLEPSRSPSCAFLDTADSVGGYYPMCGGEGRMGFFPGGMMVGPETGLGADGGGVYGPGSVIQRVYSSGDMQMMGDGQHLMGGCGGSPSPLPTTSDISALDESTFKVGRLSAEERKEKIHRYMKKRNERNFSKKIKYACRKTLADSRPRVRGRFAKNDEFGEATTRPNSSNHEYYDDEVVVVKEEDMLDSSDILAHISGVNSFKYNYTLEPWI